MKFFYVRWPNGDHQLVAAMDAHSLFWTIDEFGDPGATMIKRIMPIEIGPAFAFGFSSDGPKAEASEGLRCLLRDLSELEESDLVGFVEGANEAFGSVFERVDWSRANEEIAESLGCGDGDSR